MALRRDFRPACSAAVTAACLLVATWLTVGGIVRGRLAEQAAGSALLRVQALESTLAKQRAVAAILSDDDTLRKALTTGSPAALADVSRKLDRLREETESAVICILNLKARRSRFLDYDELVSFVGVDYSFREYYADALQTGKARAICAGVGHRPGLYLVQPGSMMPRGRSGWSRQGRIRRG
ncbi:hypothetical protein PE067_03125 [Paracoccus sp. DMF-8]|uniref:hypothetical protein n=1 Tax=Paracoccus sp. DMF-8 TaxID=3019445 RepID=UPI0023E77889|nr:hypothetical protein [Paracoccus sp. DMF-8]MDF3605238.1 hypothetical protein [Paracoccus sp. DMF-8]